ncbi:unnamed protein product [Adineta ricciae]|uniref:Uncharacterized protein n=2 Tax=Adineta ricciae TaxID=249248 RepID=A0A813X2X3_ADIRI|nr:unnamed protein product [Adineta ricciae]
MILFDSSIIFIDDLSCVCDLLPDRKKSTYQQLFKELKSIAALKNKLFEPERVVNDFEIGLILAEAAEFPQAIHQDLSTTYAEVDEMRSCCRKLMGLCLLPLQEVENQFYNLRALLDSRLKQELRQLFLYF